MGLRSTLKNSNKTLGKEADKWGSTTDGPTIQIEETKKVEFVFDMEKLNEDNFLNKLSTTIARITEYQTHVGSIDQGRRKMKFQGVMKPGCTVDL